MEFVIGQILRNVIVGGDACTHWGGQGGTYGLFERLMLQIRGPLPCIAGRYASVSIAILSELRVYDAAPRSCVCVVFLFFFRCPYPDPVLCSRIFDTVALFRATQS